MRTASLFIITAALTSAPAVAEPTVYPLTVENCGKTLTFDAPPQRVVSVGQATTEILYSLGLADRVVGTAVWFGPVLADYVEVNEGIERLADNDPSFESVVGRTPDLVTAQYEWHIGASGSVGTREQFAGLGIATYIAPADCVAKDNTTGGDGVRMAMFSMDLVYQSIDDLARIFDVQARGDALVAELKARERAAIESVAGRQAEGVPVVFWFSSKEVQGEAFVAGINGTPAYMMQALGARNVITTEEEWPLVGWETIVGADPQVIVIARMDRRRFPADDEQVKLEFLRGDPVTRELDAVRNERFVIMDAQAMNPSLRTIEGIEVLAAGLKQYGLTE